MPPVRISNGDAMPKSTTSSAEIPKLRVDGGEPAAWVAVKPRTVGKDTAPAATYAIMAA